METGTPYSDAMNAVHFVTSTGAEIQRWKYNFALEMSRGYYEAAAYWLSLLSELSFVKIEKSIVVQLAMEGADVTDICANADFIESL